MTKVELLEQVAKLIEEYEIEHNEILGGIIQFPTEDIHNDAEYEYNGEYFEILPENIKFKKIRD